MDDRTLRDGTILLVKWELWTEHIDPNATEGVDSDANLEDKEGRQTIRVPLAEALDTMYGIRNIPVKFAR